MTRFVRPPDVTQAQFAGPDCNARAKGLCGGGDDGESSWDSRIAHLCNGTDCCTVRLVNGDDVEGVRDPLPVAVSLGVRLGTSMGCKGIFNS